MGDALEDAIKQAKREAAREVVERQGSLFGAPVPDPDGVGDLAEGAEAPRGRGRPPGSRNKATDEWVRFLSTRYPSPLIGLAEVACASPHDLAAEMQCSPLEALDRIQQARRDLAPYLHQKLPQAIELPGGENLMTLVFNLGSGGSSAAIEAGPPRTEPLTADDLKALENQGVSEADPARSEGEGRNG